jgi:DNA-binding SARP family transcriptional activator/streptogramin lyase
VEPLEFRLLGPFEVVSGGRPVELGGVRQRSLLALLVLHRGEALSAERLSDELWAESAAASTKTVQVYVSRLRKVLGDGVIATGPAGYRLEAAPGSVDVDRFEQLVGDGRYRQALALWRGAPLSDLAGEEFAQREIARLEELRLSAFEQLFAAELERGKASELVPELEALVRSQPLRERLRAQLMLALYRAGRQADALAAYREARTLFRNELGLEPGPQLQELERKILNHDPGLAAPRAPILARRRRAGLILVLGGLLLAAAAAATLLVAATRGSRAAFVKAAVPNSVVAIDPQSNRMVALVPVGVTPSRIAAGEGAVWALNGDDRTLSRIDPETKAVRTVSTGASSQAELAVGDGSVWIGGGLEGKVLQLDPGTTRLVRSIRLAPPNGRGRINVGPISAGRQGVWALGQVAVPGVNAARSLAWRLDPRTGSLSSPRTLGEGAGAMTTGAGSVWVRFDWGVDRFDARTGERQAEITLQSNAFVTEDSSGIAFGAGSVWAGSAAGDVVWRIDPGTNQPAASIPTVGTPRGVAFGQGSVWIADETRGFILRVDPATNQVVKAIPIGATPNQVAFGFGRLWVTVD